MNLEKRALLNRLVKQRKDPTGWIPEGFCRVGDAQFHNGFNECEHVVPWTKGACNYDATVMIMGPDWDSADALSKPLTDRLRRMQELGRDDLLPTNKAIHKLLGVVGFTFSETYATDLCPFIKPSHMRSGIERAILEACALRYGLEQVAIIRPKIVICLGRSTTYPAMRRAAKGEEKTSPAGDLPLGPFVFAGAKVFGVTHPRSNGNRRPRRIETEWAFIRGHLERLDALQQTTTNGNH